ncbi:hypothetical protein E1I69_18520 [Bacillus timonensis]|uniref:C4-dicarboxylate ABC transporter n=1 Tax=Bacillus timonensis TaxID=1033734 RepID=A0A4S3PN23_9BACI|nr:hypothetical protein [Bacillus timonensis]THE10516.1 hypothetical protein E1I69_18520 [Bacillus timonensis]
MRVFAYSLLIFFYILSRFIEHPLLSFSMGICATIALIISLFYARGLYLKSGLIFTIIGFFLFFQSQLEWEELFLNFEAMLGMLSLFLFLPFINSLIRVGRYDQSLSLFLQQGITHLSKLYTRSFLVTHLLGLFLNIATIPLLSNSLNNSMKQLPKKTIDKFKAQSLLRSYALCLSWSPMEVMVSISLDITRANYIHILPLMLIIVLIATTVDLTFAHFKYKQELNINTVVKEISPQKFRKNVTEMLILLVIFIIGVNLLQLILNKGYLFSIILLILPISIVWAFVIRRPKRYLKMTVPHWIERTNNLSNYFFMFLTAGFFVGMLSAAGHLEFLQTIFSANTENTLLFFLMIGVYFLITALIGFHPLVSITLIAELLAPIIPSIPSISLTLVFISCSLATIIYSPYNVSLSILADIIKVNPYKVGLMNIPYALFYMLLTIGVAYLITLL